MISIIRETVLDYNWLTEDKLLDIIAVAESTPGPIAVNMATFIGSNEAGFFGALLATLGVILPAFIIMLVIVTLSKNLLKYEGVKAFLRGVKPTVVALILSTGIIMTLSQIFNIKTKDDSFKFNYKAFIILAIIVSIAIIYKKVFKKKISPILMIVISAILGLIIYSI